ncbi:YfiT family bacillithiol transferase [Lysinibacillus piscis]|uniref:Putative metal-dependent hydrolase LYSBPC_26460 n=1 Tax=Lysinibacillus piscis TaxID=2518931 RepID=A0ABQ5NMK3_9BACI|nr:bacillithiol transferase BstA [Lysinibacillus sp. KH24]GLC89519.1 putative metal-dependent hydrolase [Lysinibacillus sp. KH24]
MKDARYPIGPFEFSEVVGKDQVDGWIEEIRLFPSKLASTLSGASEQALEKTYREGGWTVKQLVHHLADSHMNSYIRFKLALTEDTPTIKPYDEAAWAKLPDSEMPITTSYKLIEYLHERWVYLLTSFTEEQWQATFNHPDAGIMTLEKALALYVWHGKHHLAHIQYALAT